ncbi:hypothetical protein D3C86_1599120 [compost metagenome]
MLGDVGVDVLGGLLTADAEALRQVHRGQPAFPPRHGFDQSVAKGEVPTDLLDGLLAFHVASM